MIRVIADDRPEWARDKADDPDAYRRMNAYDGCEYALVETSDGDYFVPVVDELCPICEGSGEVDDPWGDDGYDDDIECFECDGDGWLYCLNWDEAMTSDEFTGWNREHRYLERRYGSVKVNSIADFWLA